MTDHPCWAAASRLRSSLPRRPEAQCLPRAQVEVQLAVLRAADVVRRLMATPAEHVSYRGDGEAPWLCAGRLQDGWNYGDAPWSGSAFLTTGRGTICPLFALLRIIRGSNLLGGRSTVGQQTLTLLIGGSNPASQPDLARSLASMIMRGIGRRFVHILRRRVNPSRHTHAGITEDFDVSASAGTTKDGYTTAQEALATRRAPGFLNERAANRFERHLKSDPAARSTSRLIASRPFQTSTPASESTPAFGKVRQTVGASSRNAAEQRSGRFQCFSVWTDVHRRVQAPPGPTTICRETSKSAGRRPAVPFVHRFSH